MFKWGHVKPRPTSHNIGPKLYILPHPPAPVHGQTGNQLPFRPSPAMQSAPAIATVSQVTRRIKDLLEGKFRFVQVSGEISNLRRPASGHCYFTLKDEDAQLAAVLFKNQQRYLLEQPRDGQQVICHGRVSVYEPRGSYQLIIDTIDFHGQGLLQLRFAELKKRLANEGLFGNDHKKKLPSHPRRITLVTSTSGAAVHDFLSIWRKRGRLVRVDIYPVRVQGKGAEAEISQAIEELNRRQHCDVIVLCRGGGSLEDLWPFNEELPAWTIFHSQIPVVSAVGHEIDFTIADFCADMRAPTPTGAAELLLPDQAQLAGHLATIRQRLARSLDNRLTGSAQQLRHTVQRLGSLDSLFIRQTLRLPAAEDAGRQRKKGIPAWSELDHEPTRLLTEPRNNSGLEKGAFTRAGLANHR